MKKILLVLPLVMLLGACAKEAGSQLSSLSIPDSYSDSASEGEERVYSVKLTPDNSGLQKDGEGNPLDSTSPINLSLESQQDKNVKYDLILGDPCYLSTKAHEFIMKKGSYIKSVSTYKVDRIIVDFFSGKGVNFGVYANNDGSGTALEPHESTIAPEDPNDTTLVYEYEINGSAWYMKNITEFNKPGIYSVTVVFTK